MAWAIDLDDGNTINALGSDLSGPKSPVFHPSSFAPKLQLNGFGKWLELCDIYNKQFMPLFSRCNVTSRPTHELQNWRVGRPGPL